VPDLHPVIPPLAHWQGDSELHPYLVCDVFTDRPLEGNQLGVFVDGRPFSDEEMLRLTREMYFAETVFLRPPRAGGDVWVRIFTAGGELPFAGHPTLGTGFVVAEALGKDEVTLETGIGPIPLQLRREQGRVVFGWMQQRVPTPAPYEHEAELLAALGLTRSRLPVEQYRNGPLHVYVAFGSEDELAAIKPDLNVLAELGIGANCFAGSGRSWQTRMFLPAHGVSEDPATGSAAGPLAVHLVRHGEVGYGEEIRIRQGVHINRPSLLHARVTGEGDRVDTVEVGGSAVIVAEGQHRVA
jgi:trans-2,3-dihydro-3-hydroxyanthranilate isomerase